MKYRIENDSIGKVNVPINAYFGSQTIRASQNFPISNFIFQKSFINAIVLIKLSAAKANMELKLLNETKAKAIIEASSEIINGKFSDQFIVDVFQTGSGTSTNMNVNEVISNRAIEILGGKKGDKTIIHPNDDVNMGQSTNDVFPTAIHIAVSSEVINNLFPSLNKLHLSLNSKSIEFQNIIKSGRTHFQDAVPITLGQEFNGYTIMIKKSIKRIEKSLPDLNELPIGGTATGTGLNAHPQLSKKIINTVNSKTGLTFKIAESRFESMQGKDACVALSSNLKILAGSLMRFSNDIRLLSSGPNTGIGEIEIPETQPGSSIMPGKVNPIILESTNLVAAQVIGNDHSINIANQLGELELNMGMPLIAHNLLQSIGLLVNAINNLVEKCINDLKAKSDICLNYAESSPSIITAIAPIIGYDKAAQVAKAVVEKRKSVREMLIEYKLVPSDQIDKILNLKKMTKGGILKFEESKD